MSYCVDRHYKRLKRNPRQPRRTKKAVKEIGLQELRKQGLSKRVTIKIANPYGAPRARAEYMPHGNIIKLHPINRFATKADLRGTVRHEITRFRDEQRGTRKAKEF